MVLCTRNLFLLDKMESTILFEGVEKITRQCMEKKTRNVEQR